jgi:hypothetical protein
MAPRNRYIKIKIVFNNKKSKIKIGQVKGTINTKFTKGMQKAAVSILKRNKLKNKQFLFTWCKLEESKSNFG